MLSIQVVDWTLRTECAYWFAKWMMTRLCHSLWYLFFFKETFQFYLFFNFFLNIRKYFWFFSYSISYLFLHFCLYLGFFYFFLLVFPLISLHSPQCFFLFLIFFNFLCFPVSFFVVLLSCRLKKWRLNNKEYNFLNRLDPMLCSNGLNVYYVIIISMSLNSLNFGMYITVIMIVLGS